MANGTIHIGTSGWNYKHWLGNFYPDGTRAVEQLTYYSKFLSTVELNNSFYRLSSKETFEKWKTNVPAGFVFAVKASRFITHMKKLNDPHETLKMQLLNMHGLGKKLGPLLFQLPPSWNINPERLNLFLKTLPRKFRYVIEFRNHTWYDRDIYKLLEKYHCAFCIYHLSGHLSPLKITADFVYVRLHGPGEKYQGSYNESALKKWGSYCLKWSRQKKDVYVYFDNDEAGYAALNAIRLSELIKNGKKS